MAIEDKIKEIQGKSENARMAYIFVLVTIAMTFIIVLWVFSIRVDVQAVVNDVDNVTSLPDGGSNLQEIRDAIGESSSVLGDAIQQAVELEEATQNTQNTLEQ